MQKVKERLSHLMMTQEKRGQYYRYIDQVLTTKNEIEVAEERGINTGIKKGLKQGKVEGKKEVVVEMLRHGIDYDTIHKITGLTTDAIKDLDRS